MAGQRVASCSYLLSQRRTPLLTIVYKLVVRWMCTASNGTSKKKWRLDYTIEWCVVLYGDVVPFQAAAPGHTGRKARK